ncbi:hypothetical protein [Methyloversatilis universalis]|uniref:hypothetical protein n=1 Tax=Methyloversatilis universalis TaxID=378211 RepID=UPI0003AA347F|nr:hypothetical protein [Methyloversatilis universalis]
MGVLAHVLDSAPSIAWSLATKLLPSAHDTSSPTRRPTFREYGEGSAEVLTYGVIWEFQAFVIGKAIGYAGNDPERWVTLIDALSNFPEQALEVTAAALENVLAYTTGDAQVVVWDALRKEVNRHRTYAEAEWSLPEVALSKLDVLVQTFAPTSAVARATWLFDDWMPDVPGKTQEGGCPEAEINSARFEAICDVVKESGTAGLINLAERVKLPDQVAYVAQGLELDFGALINFFSEALRADPQLDTVAAVILAEGARRFNATWKASICRMLLEERVPTGRIARLLMALEESTETWNFVRDFGGDVDDSYWQHKHSYPVSGSAEELVFAVDKYLACKRPLAALDAAGRRMSDLTTEKLMSLLDESVAEINASDQAPRTMAVYNIERAFDELRKRIDTDLDAIAALEFRYLPVFRVRKKPLVLHSLLIRHPKLFMDTICLIFRPANGDDPPPVEGAEKQAAAAYELLAGVHVLPGQNDDEIDGQFLLDWCIRVRCIAAEVDREKITDQRIGAILAHAPISRSDNAWPHEAVRSIIERLCSPEIERGLAIERFNMRGVYSKAMDEGGDQERALANQSQAWADAMPEYPRTAAMLVGIANNWLREAERADVDAQQGALRW